ncbi:hypothetical protein FQR65_LT16628 [Abscondita terminalis]|nr:hypothetical protein FQR65_LT16628 [Abscondita terminalis]
MNVVKVIPREVLIKKKLEEGYEVIFIGKHGHPETIALTSIDTNKVHLVTNLEEVKKLNISHKKLFITNQTTLSLIDTQSIYESLKEKYPNIEFKNDLCDATLERQEAILKLKPEEIDLLFIVGDQRSNNTLKLVELGNSIGIRSIRINQKEDILDEWLVDVNTVAVSAGASTSSIVQNQVIKFLEEKNRI